MKRIGIVGVGGIAQAYIEALDGVEFATIVAVADVREEAAVAAAESANCEKFVSHQSMAEKMDLDAVIICTPPSTHPAIATYFLDRKIPVLCEKPLAIDEENALRIINSAKNNDTLLSMASKFRYVEDVIRLKSIITSGVLGEISLVENAFASPVDMSQRWNSNPEISGGGVLIDNGTHSVDIIRYLVGPIKDVIVVTDTFSEGLKVDDNAYLLAETESGIAVRVDLSWTFDKQLPNFISVYGSQGTAHVGWKESQYMQHSNGQWIKFGDGYNKMSAFQTNVKRFCSAIDNNPEQLVSIDDALSSVEVIQTAYRSATTTQWEQVSSSNKQPPKDNITLVSAE